MKYTNLGILAHVDAGKTTLVEQFLYLGGELRAAGSVDKGNTQTDWLPVERERGISVRSSSVSLEHMGVRLNIIDTPGHFDFTGEVERALSALDAAILVVSAAEGIQSQTVIFWQACRTLGIPALIFVNKIDRAGCDPLAVAAALRDEFSEAIFALNTPAAPGGRDCGVVPAPFTDDGLLTLCELDEALAALYLSGDGGGPTPARLDAALVRQTRAGRACPLLFGSAALGVGVRELFDAAVTYLPAADETPDGDLLGVVYKIEHEGTMGKIAHVRLYAGTLRNRDMVTLEHIAGFGGAAFGGGYADAEDTEGHGVDGDRTDVTDVTDAGDGETGGETGRSVCETADRFTGDTTGRFVEEKVTQIRRIAGARREDRGVLCGGDIAAVYGLTGAKTGDLVRHRTDTVDVRTDTRGVSSLDAAGGPGRRLRLLGQLALAAPLFSVQVFAEPGQESAVLRAVSELTDEDPLLEYEWEPDERELIIRVMGKIQLEILETLFLTRYGLRVSFSAPTVIYKETPKQAGTGFEAYTMPKPCWAVVRLLVEPLPRGAGYRYASVIKGKELPYRYQHHVALTVPGALKQGMYNWEVTDLKVTLIGGEHHHVHTHPMDFFLATPIAVMKALQDAGTELLEPLTRVRMTAAENLTGRLLGDITAMRGQFDDPVMKNGDVTVEALLPVASSIDFPTRFASMTSGKGTLRSSFAGYRECPAELGAAAKRRGVNPLDRMRWILYKRNALT